ncbi:UNVERIFIED_CONTAM: hypothetical protein GTU68_033252 [Idotea baltica]|nr:hypothetical protein [Idotea baltica]
MQLLLVTLQSVKRAQFGFKLSSEEMSIKSLLGKDLIYKMAA